MEARIHVDEICRDSLFFLAGWISGIRAGVAGGWKLTPFWK
jgi:hypothetical protein